MANNKENERAELHKTIWRIANDLRGSVDGWDFKTYVLGMLFYRFISENLTSYLNEQERKAGTPDFDYARLIDADAEFGRAETVKNLRAHGLIQAYSRTNRILNSVKTYGNIVSFRDLEQESARPSSARSMPAPAYATRMTSSSSLWIPTPPRPGWMLNGKPSWRHARPKNWNASSPMKI